MFEKLLSLFLQAKSGAIATVLVVGASGALVTATVENGTATIKITDPAAQSAVTQVTGTTVANTNKDTDTTKVNPAILALFNRTQSEQDPTGTATGKDCKDEPKAVSDQVKRVNDAFKTDMKAIEKLSEDPRGEAGKTLVKNAKKAVKDIRQAAVKGIHATTTASAKCDDEDEDKETEEHDGANHDVKHEAVDEDGDHEDADAAAVKPTTVAPTVVKPTTPSVAFSGTEAKAIADLAISAMDLQVTNLKADLAKLPKTDATTNGNKSKDQSKDKGKDQSKDKDKHN
jgi:hypothetical protein